MLVVAVMGGGSGVRCRFMEKQLIYSVRYSGEKHTLSFWLVNGRYMYSVDKKQQLRDLETGYKKGRIRKSDYINITENAKHNFIFV